MKPPDTAVVRRVQEWLAHADEDLRLARFALTMASGCPYRLIAYHAQQCAEKALKAYLVFRIVDFPYTHRISRLLDLCPPERRWPEILRDAEELTPYVITARYPEGKEGVTGEEALRAVEIAAKVRAAILAALADEGMDVGDAAS